MTILPSKTGARPWPLRIGAGWRIEKYRLFTDSVFQEGEQVVKLLFASKAADGTWVSTESITVYFQRNFPQEEGYFLICYVTPSFSKSYVCRDMASVEENIMSLASYDQPDLQPFSFPAGWYIRGNRFTTLNPEALGPSDWEKPLFLFEDIAQFEFLTNEDRWTIDVGYYPEDSPEGAFGCYLIKNVDWQEPEDEFRSRSQPEAAKKIQLWIDRISGEK
ncbi:hypothetical protein [Leminorella grimontii]|uniref:hypothetical protein n=1 Tax=Leminorella grimontii TaxID=82981 RepID=UPI0032207ACB